MVLLQKDGLESAHEGENGRETKFPLLHKEWDYQTISTINVFILYVLLLYVLYICVESLYDLNFDIFRRYSSDKMKSSSIFLFLFFFRD